MVGCDRPGQNPTPTAGKYFDRGGGARRIRQHEIAGHMRGHAVQDAQGVADAIAGFQNIAQDGRDPEPLRHVRPAAIGKCDGQACVVDAVGQSPEKFDHSHDRPLPAAGEQEAFVQVRREVVVAHQPDMPSVGECRQRTAAKIRRRTPGRQETGRTVGTTGKAEQRVIGRHQFRHVLRERRLAGSTVRSIIAAAGNKPRLVGRPGPEPALLPFGSGSVFVDRGERE